LTDRQCPGWFKFGGVEFFKINISHSIGDQKAWDNQTAIYLVRSIWGFSHAYLLRESLAASNSVWGYRLHVGHATARWFRAVC
jgi:hypothetical protein